MSDLAGTSGVTLGCMVACASMYLVLDEESTPALVKAYTPAGALSFAFMGVLVISELLQDWLVAVVLIDERCMPRAMCALSEDSRELIYSKLLPPVFSSWAGFSDFMLPLLAAGSLTHAFVYSMTELYIYELSGEYNSSSTPS